MHTTMGEIETKAAKFMVFLAFLLIIIIFTGFISVYTLRMTMNLNSKSKVALYSIGQAGLEPSC